MSIFPHSFPCSCVRSVCGPRGTGDHLHCHCHHFGIEPNEDREAGREKWWDHKQVSRSDITKFNPQFTMGCPVKHLTLVWNKIVYHSDVVGASPDGAAPTTFSFLTSHPALIDWAKTTARQNEIHLSFRIWCALYQRFDRNMYAPFRYLQFAPQIPR